MLDAAIIGIRDRLALAPGNMIEQKGKLGAATGRLKRFEDGEIVQVECDHMVEMLEILGRNLTGA